MKIKDYLLRFDSKEQAIAFGRSAISAKDAKLGEVSRFQSIKHAEANGIGVKFVANDEHGEAKTITSTHAYAIHVIGSWLKQVGEDKEGNPIMESDGLHWVLVRDLEGLKVPEGADKFIVWTSDDGDRPEDMPQDVFANENISNTTRSHRAR